MNPPHENTAVFVPNLSWNWGPAVPRFASSARDWTGRKNGTILVRESHGRLRVSRSRRSDPRWKAGSVSRRDAREKGKVQSSTALNREGPVNRYIDLRSMRVIHSNEAHIHVDPPVDVSCGLFANPRSFGDPRWAAELRDLFFTPDTIALTESQKQVVEALLLRRSVLHVSCAGEEKDAIVVDMVLRNRLSKDCIMYCASSRRAAESVYVMLCAQLGPEKRSELCLDYDNKTGFFQRAEHRDSPRVFITAPHALRTMLATCDSGGWISDVSVVFIDNFSMSSLGLWEEIILAMPSQVLLCIFAKQLSVSDRELLPLWLETVQNMVVSVTPAGTGSIIERIDRPQNFPLLRTFAFNAAIHESPVQVSLVLLRDMLVKEYEDANGNFVPKFEDCFLHGITTIPIDDPRKLKFTDEKEAEYADVACMIAADARRTSEKVKSRTRRRSKGTKKRERTASSRAAARRRREAAYEDSLLFPAIILIQGHTEVLSACEAIKSSVKGCETLLWDDDSRSQLEEIVEGFVDEHHRDLSRHDLDTLRQLIFGIGIIHRRLTSTVRSLVEEVFRSGFIPAIIVDTHVGSKELSALAPGKAVVLESSALATCDDTSKGLIPASAAAALCGRPGKDDVGTLIVSWYDKTVDDESAGSDIAATLMRPIVFESEEWLASDGVPSSSSGALYRDWSDLANRKTGRSQPNSLARSYDGILRSLRRFGVDGYGAILDHTLHSFKGWLERASLHATVEKLNVEKETIDATIEEEDWTSIADYERRCAKWNESYRVFSAMEQRLSSVLVQGVLDDLRRCEPGRIVGVRCAKGYEDSIVLGKTMMEGVRSEDGMKSRAENSRLGTLERHEEGQGEFGSKSSGMETLLEAVFVALRDQELDSYRKSSINSRWEVVCILGDGMWTLLPIEDVIAISSTSESLVPNVDLLPIPHPATFDLDPTSKWGKCSPVDDVEKAAVHNISDELIAQVASHGRPALDRYRVSGFEAQKERLQSLEKLKKQSSWYGREDEIQALHLLRRRSAELGDEVSVLQEKENRLEDSLFLKHKKEILNQESVLAVLEDCHAMSVLGDLAMELTPIGALASVLPASFPLFAAACLSLVDKSESLSPWQFVSFVAVIAVGTNSRFDLSNVADVRKNTDFLNFSVVDKDDLNHNSTNRSIERNDLEGLPDGDSPNGGEIELLASVLPEDICLVVKEIRLALEQLHRRHQDVKSADEEMSVEDIVPTFLDTEFARAAFSFSSGSTWEYVSDQTPDSGAVLLEELRKVLAILEIVSSEREGEFSPQMRKLATVAKESLNRWPIRDELTLTYLVDSGVVEKLWSGTTYDKWWRSVRDKVSAIESTVSSEESKEDNGAQNVEADMI